jgi:hypothetical protein
MPAISDTLAPVDGETEIKALLGRHGLSGAAAAVAFFSFADPARSFIGAHDPDGRITPLIEFLPLPVRGGDLLEAIGAIDENAPRLVANYQAAFPEIITRVRAFGADLEPATTESLRWLLSACSLVLWLEEADVARALAPSPGGVKADTVVIEQDGRYMFDGRRLLRSLMSYRLADVPNHVLARSVFESLGGFTADAIRRLLRDWKADAVVCAGDLFARNKILRERARASMLRLRVPVYLAPEGDG